MVADLRFEYAAQQFRQRDGSPEILLFVAPAAEIRKWAGVPRKTFDYQHGFQRTLNPSRVSEVADFFREDPNNISPTAIVIGFTDDASLKQTKSADEPSLTRIQIRLPDLEEETVDALIKRGIAALECRLSPNLIEQVKANVDAAVASAMQIQEEDRIDDEFGIVEETPSANLIAEEPSRSYLADFYAELMGFDRGLRSFSSCTE